jgi:hypothetical protein
MRQRFTAPTAELMETRSRIEKNLWWMEAFDKMKE